MSASTVPKLTPLKSSNIESAGFDHATGTLTIKFKSGGTYHHSGCRQSHFDDLCAAESAGKWYHKNIRGQFKHTKASDTKAA